MRHIYGPIKSRRLGNSLGVDLVPYKFCCFDCIYCQLKKTAVLTLKRKEYVKSQEIVSELEYFLKQKPPEQKIDFITISGSGEPLLNSKINQIIDSIKEITPIPVALITNSALFIEPKVRNEVLNCDLILPSLDAVTQDVFEKIDRPHKDLKINDIIKGLIALRKDFKNKIWLEIMLVKGINDDSHYIEKFKNVLSKIKPDKIHLNTVSRPPSEIWVRSPSLQRLKKIKLILGKNCELI